MPRHVVRTAGAIAVFLIWSGAARAEDPSVRAWSLGVNAGGAGLGYHFSPRWSAELRAQDLSGVFAGGARANFHFRPRLGVQPYAGIEGDFTYFKGAVSQGVGYAAEGYLGAEYYFARAWSAVLDVGPAWLSLADNKTDEAVHGVEVIINLGINYHFGKKEVSR